MSIEKTFLGNEKMTIDGKGRVAIPARYLPVLRAICPDQADMVGLMITPDRSIKIMPANRFEAEIERWSQLNDQLPAERMVLNLSTSLAEVVNLDTQNRIKLNPVMKEVCSIDRQVIFVGSVQYMQLFDANIWRKMVLGGLKQFSAAAGEIASRQTSPAPIQYVINAGGSESPPAKK